MSRSRRPVHPFRGLAALALGATLLGGLSGCGGAPASGVAAPAPAVSTAIPGAATSGTAGTTDPPSTAGAPGVPVSLTLGGGPARPVEALGVDADGVINPPAGVVQWYEESPRPGEPGIAVIAGHVSYDGVPDAFADLASVQVGDPVVVRDEHGQQLRYRVSEVRLADKDDVMVDQDVWGPSEHSRLAIVTCDDTSRVEDGVHYAGNVVVEAELAP